MRDHATVEREGGHAIGSVVVATRQNWGAADVRMSLKYKLTGQANTGFEG